MGCESNMRETTLKKTKKFVVEVLKRRYWRTDMTTLKTELEQWVQKKTGSRAKGREYNILDKAISDLERDRMVAREGSGGQQMISLKFDSEFYKLWFDLKSATREKFIGVIAGLIVGFLLGLIVS